MVSDSTYVVNCFRDRWWQGWLERGWTNSARKPVANRDLWEPLIGLYVDRGDVAFDWVKGHSGDRMNDLVDALAVAACPARVTRNTSPSLWIDPKNPAPWRGKATHPIRRSIR